MNKKIISIILAGIFVVSLSVFIMSCNVESVSDLSSTNNQTTNQIQTNTPPRIDYLNLEKYNAYTGEIVYGSFKISDPDNTSLTVSLKAYNSFDSLYIIPTTNLQPGIYQFFLSSVYQGTYYVRVEVSDGKSNIQYEKSISFSDSASYDSTIDLRLTSSWSGSVYIYSYAQPGTTLKVISPSSPIYVQVYGTSGFDPVIKGADYKGAIVATIDQNLTGVGEQGFIYNTGFVYYVWIYDYYLNFSGYTTVYISR